jgi:hypothetical protein
MHSNKTSRVTLARINAALQRAGFGGVSLVKGAGYYYFAGGESDKWQEQGVYGAGPLGTLTVEQWVFEAHGKRASSFLSLPSLGSMLFGGQPADNEMVIRCASRM